MNKPTLLASLIRLSMVGAVALYLSNASTADNASANQSAAQNNKDTIHNTNVHNKQAPNEISAVRAMPATPAKTQFANITQPRSLDNTDPSSLVHVDANNNLILDSDIKMLFDYFFTSEGDLSQPELIVSMQQYIQQAYPAPASQQALDLLDKYLDYKQQMQAFYADNSPLKNLPELSSITDGDTLQTVEQLMHKRQDMREQVFTFEEMDAMFGEQLRYDQYMLNIAKIDASLSVTERSQQIEQLAYQHFTDDEIVDRQQTFILQNSPPALYINRTGDCDGNTDGFSLQQINRLCKLATAKHLRTSRQEALLRYKNDLVENADLTDDVLDERLSQQAQLLAMSEHEYKLFQAVN